MSGWCKKNWVGIKEKTVLSSQVKLKHRIWARHLLGRTWRCVSRSLVVLRMYQVVLMCRALFLLASLLEPGSNATVPLLEGWLFLILPPRFAIAGDGEFRYFQELSGWTSMTKCRNTCIQATCHLTANVFLSPLVIVYAGAAVVMCFYSCSHIFMPWRPTCSRDGTRRTSEVKCKQDVRERISFRDKGGMPSSQEGFMIFGFVFLSCFSLVFWLR